MRDVHPRVARQLLRLDDPADKEALVDQYGAVWQYGGARAPYWYRAYDSDKPVSSWELAQHLANQGDPDD